jgi:ADP-ribose pyrophosphatase
MRQCKTLARRQILSDGKFLTVEHHDVELPNGRVIRDWAWLSTPAYVNIIAVTEGERFLCFRQTKYAVEGITLAPAGGYMNPHEDPLLAAQRELLEETGYQAPEWVCLGQFAVDGNRGAGTAHLYLAQRARRVTEINSDDLEEQELLRLTRAEIEAALAAGGFKVLAWAAVVSLGLLYLNGRLTSNE